MALTWINHDKKLVSYVEFIIQLLHKYASPHKVENTTHHVKNMATWIIDIQINIYYKILTHMRWRRIFSHTMARCGSSFTKSLYFERKEELMCVIHDKIVITNVEERLLASYDVTDCFIQQLYM